MTNRPGRARPITAGSGARQGGMVTAEFAVALPAFVVVVLAALCAVAVVTAQLRCTDAADLAARLGARGESGSLVQATALRAAPSGAAVTTTTAGSMLTATVTARVSLPGLSRLLPGVDLRATAVEELEGSPPTGDVATWRRER